MGPARIAAFLGMAALLYGPAPAQEQASPQCPEQAAPIPAELAGWTGAPRAIPAATSASTLAASILPIGIRTDAALAGTPEVQYVARPEKPGGSVSFGGLYAFTVGEAGTYRVALGSGAWIDVLKDGQPVPSSGHGHGPACSGIRKMVDFALLPGDYVLQIAASGAARADVMIARLP